MAVQKFEKDLDYVNNLYADYQLLIKKEELIQRYVDQVFNHGASVQLALNLLSEDNEPEPIHEQVVPMHFIENTFNVQEFVNSIRKGPQIVGYNERKRNADKMWLPIKLSSTILQYTLEYIAKEKKDIEKELSEIQLSWNTQK